ncbi:MAG TPA: hypothetical protein VMV69_00700 [Pirellulales bacterium]|nr:hypothetical protein [Pirellulales bacterium]
MPLLDHFRPPLGDDWPDEQTHLDYWAEPLRLGAELPTMPLWLDVDLCAPVCLEESYRTACESLRMPAM